jgi:asparagine synthase (glutamine-hydrolysing)
MCGIAGVYSYNGASRLDETVGLRMIDSVKHRGPDDGGLLVGPHILLGHRRLAILDPSEAGHQPMCDSSERFWISFNGEIYNFLELRQELEACGYCFRSNTDTEMVLYAFRHWQMQAFERFNGMFAIAIWDAFAEELWLVRDPVGIKPLFYHDDGKQLRFGSEIKAILADPAVSRQPDWEGLDAFFSFGYMPAPRTGFDGIRQLLPGQGLLIDRNGLKLFSCCELPAAEEVNGNGSVDVSQFREQIDAAVSRQTISDVPLGALLSGGLDSSAIVRAMHPEPNPVLTFAMGFGDLSFDESPYAQQVATILKTDHYARRVDWADTMDLLPQLVSHAEEPIADNSIIPFFLLAKFAREKVTVALSGDGADELLAGYSTYRASKWARRYRSVPSFLRQGVIAPLVQQLPPSTRKYSPSMLLKRFVEGAEQPPLRDHCSWRQILAPRTKEFLYTSTFRDRVAGFDAIGQYAAAAETAGRDASSLNRQLEADLRFHLPNDMLVKVDRMSMAHGLEVRVPWLDLELIRYCRALPEGWKLRANKGKYILRKSLEDTLPHELVHRRKAGFVVPIELWLRGPLQPMIKEFLSERFLRTSEILQPHKVKQMVEAHACGRRDHAYELFTLLIFSIWWQIWIDRSMPPSFTDRAAAPTVIHRISESRQ